MNLPFLSDTVIFSIVGLLALVWLLCGINIVNEWERRPILRFGRYVRTLGPGFSWTEPFTHRRLEDVAINESVWQLEVSNVQTHDNVPIAFRLILTSKVDENNVQKYVVIVTDGDDAVEQRTLSTVSECVSRSELDEILHDRETLYNDITTLLQERISHWGIHILAVEFQDIRITDASIEQAISMKARASKEAEAELARARMQAQIAEELKKAAALYDADAKWLKGTETLLELCRSAENNTVLVPTDLLDGLARAGLSKVQETFLGK